MYRLGSEAILGIRRVGQALQINPRISKSWASYQVTYRDGETIRRQPGCEASDPGWKGLARQRDPAAE
jgi:hypothetical protein